MFESIPISGYALCYGPLAVVIIGFIVAAAITDSKARRTYLRYFEGRSPRTPDVAITPTGVPVTFKKQEAKSAAAESVATPTAVQPDNLQRIEGIGPKISAILAQAGITTFSQLAAKTAVELRAILDEAGMSQINDPTTWPEQASLAAQGDWEELQKLQDALTGGRRA